MSGMRQMRPTSGIGRIPEMPGNGLSVARKAAKMSAPQVGQDPGRGTTPENRYSREGDTP